MIGFLSHGKEDCLLFAIVSVLYDISYLKIFGLASFTEFAWVYHSSATHINLSG